MRQSAPAFQVRRIDPDPHAGTRSGGTSRCSTDLCTDPGAFKRLVAKTQPDTTPTSHLVGFGGFCYHTPLRGLGKGGKMCGIAGLVGDFVPGLMDRMNAAQRTAGRMAVACLSDPSWKRRWVMFDWPFWTCPISPPSP